MNLLSKIKSVFKRERVLELSDVTTQEEYDAYVDRVLPPLKDEAKSRIVFFGDGTEDELLELEREDKGLKGIFGL